MAECQAKIRRFTVSTEEWTPIIAPSACSYFAILGTEDGCALLRSSNPEDESAWYRLAPGMGYGLIVPHQGVSMARFGEGEIVTYLKACQATGPVIVEFI
jgi:hypothetical protein